VYKFFMPWIQVDDANHCSHIWIQEREMSDYYPLHSLAGNVTLLMRHSIRSNDERALWYGYAVRCCRGWNACRLAAHLGELTCDCPPLILADRMEEMGEKRLEKLLREEFSEYHPSPVCDASPLPESIRKMKTDQRPLPGNLDELCRQIREAAGRATTRPEQESETAGLAENLPHGQSHEE